MSNINTLADVVRVHGAGRPDKTALVQAGRDSVTWAQLLERSSRVAQALADAGVGAKDRVAFLDKNGIEHFDVSFGAAMLNAVSVDVNWRLAAPEVQFIVDDAEAKVLIVGPDFVPVLDAIVDQLPKVNEVRRDRRPPDARELRRLGGPVPGRRSRRAVARATTSPSSCTRRGRPGGRRA